MAIGLSVALHNDIHARCISDNSAVSDTVSASAAPLSENSKNKVIEFTGFIKYDLFADTRQVVNAREGLVSIYPENRQYDVAGHDINGGLNVNMLSIHSRLGIRAYGPVVLSARTSGFIEADFYGNANSHFNDLNGLRLFNAYIDFRWRSTELRLGQYWHPMSVREFFPNTVSFNAGAPFHPMSRNPQARIQHTIGGFRVTGAILTQRDFTSTGPDGPGSHYLRNAGIPNVHLQLQYGSDSSAISGGAGIDHKRIVPALSTINEIGEVFKSKSSVSSVSLTGFMKVESERLALTVQGVYAQNAYDLLMLGGYVERNTPDAYTSEKTYANLNVVALWADAATELGGLQLGAFLGYTKNMGTGKAIGDAVYSRGEDIGWIYRVSPRIEYLAGPIGIALEGEYTVAGYGTPNDEGIWNATELTAVANFRSLLSVKYVF